LGETWVKAQGGYRRVAFGECKIFTPAGNGGIQMVVPKA